MKVPAMHLPLIEPLQDTISVVNQDITRKTVVVAEARKSVHVRFCSALEDTGHRVVIVESVHELLECVSARLTELDLLILSLKLQDSDGIEFVRSLKKIDEGKIPTLILSSTIENAEQIRELAKLKLAGYINDYSSAETIRTTLTPHLFPDNFNRRSSARVVISLPASYRTGETLVTATTLNLSKGGVALRTLNPLDKATKAFLQFRLPGTSHNIDTEARVAWSDRRGSMGLQFEKISPADQALINNFIDTKSLPRQIHQTD